MDIEFLFCGDTMLGACQLATNPFEEVRAVIQSADIAFCNLETSLAGPGAALSKRHVIETHPENLNYLRTTGFSIVNLANNHVLDRGEVGCGRMVELLKGMDIGVLGLQASGRAKPVVVSCQGIRIGFLSYADYGFRGTFMPLRPRIALADVEELSRQVECVVVSLHWGLEYVEFPAPEQQRFARSLIDAGAQMVIGHHPHVVQGIEEYRGGLIAYSLGNFQFRIELGDRFLSRGTGIMLRIHRSKEGQLRYEALPVELSASDRVEFSQDRDSRRSLDRLAELSTPVNGKRINRLKWMREASRLWFPSQLESWFFRVRRFGTMQALRMLGWLLRPSNVIYLLLYLVCPKHESSQALFQKRER
jgi:hypothetical protein